MVRNLSASAYTTALPVSPPVFPPPGRRRRQLRGDLLTEKIRDADQFVDLRRPLHRRFGLDGEGDDEVNRRVFRLPRSSRVGSVLSQKSGDVTADGLGHHLREFRREPLDELTRASASCVRVGTLDVAADVLYVVGLEQFLIVLAEL